MKNYYEILEVSQNASIVDIERAYKSILIRYHPESFAGEARTIVEKKIENVKEAYSILSDEFLRDQYDKEIGIQHVKQKQQDTREELKQMQQQREEFYKQLDVERKNAMKNNKNNKKKKVGMFGSMADLSKDVVSSLPEIKLQKPTKKGLLALLAAIAIVVLMGVILWFIPFTNNFMREFLVLK